MILGPQTLIQRAAVLTVASALLAACSNPNAYPCSAGYLHVRDDGSIQDQFFAERPAHDELSVKDQIEDALVSGYPYSVILDYTITSKSGSERRFIIAAEGKSTVRYASGTTDLFASTLEIPSLYTAPDYADATSVALKGSETVSAVVNSNGDLLLDGEWPIKLKSVTWCLR